MALETELSATSGEFWHSQTRRSFFYPHQVAADPHLTSAEKRKILSAWASDMHAVESMPALRHMPGTPFPVTYSAIMDARALLDRSEAFAGEIDETPLPPSGARLHRRRPPQMEAA